VIRLQVSVTHGDREVLSVDADLDELSIAERVRLLSSTTAVLAELLDTPRAEAGS
jgi:hypothetical protein